MGHLSFRHQLFHGSLPTVGHLLVVLPLDKVCPVNNLGVMLKVAEGACQGLLGFPFRVMFFGELVVHVRP